MDNSSVLTLTLPTDILTEVLCRLSVKTLIQFCCVCKTWKNLICSDHFFIKSHLTQSRRKTSSVLMYSSDSRLSRDFPTNLTPKFITSDKYSELCAFSLGYDFFLVGCINGVFCFYKFYDFDIYLWNPALRQLRLLPQGSIYYRRYFNVIGFVYGSNVDDDDDYKVVTIFVSKDKLKLEIYSLSSNRWRTIIIYQCCPLGRRIYTNHSVAVVQSGALYWLSHRCGDEDRAIFLNEFDLRSEKFRETLLPDCVPKSDPCLGVFKECLCICGWSTGKRYEVWLMKECGVENSWTKQFEFPSCIIPQAGYMSGFRTSGKFVAICQKDVVLYDPESEEIYKKSELVLKMGINYFFTDNYVESLVSVMSADELTGDLGYPSCLGFLRVLLG